MQLPLAVWDKPALPLVESLSLAFALPFLGELILRLRGPNPTFGGNNSSCDIAAEATGLCGELFMAGFCRSTSYLNI